MWHVSLLFDAARILLSLLYYFWNTSPWLKPPTKFKQINRSLVGYTCLVGMYSGVLALYLFSLWWRGSIWKLLSKLPLLQQLKVCYSPAQRQNAVSYRSSESRLLAIYSLYLGNRFPHYQQCNRIWKWCFIQSHGNVNQCFFLLV